MTTNQKYLDSFGNNELTKILQPLEDIVTNLFINIKF